MSNLFVLEKILRENSSDRAKDVTVSLSFANVQQRLLYFPLYVTTYQYDGKSYQVVVNGQSGKVSANRPYGLGKVGEFGSALGSLFFGSNK